MMMALFSGARTACTRLSRGLESFFSPPFFFLPHYGLKKNTIPRPEVPFNSHNSLSVTTECSREGQKKEHIRRAQCDFVLFCFLLEVPPLTSNASCLPSTTCPWLGTNRCHPSASTMPRCSGHSKLYGDGIGTEAKPLQCPTGAPPSCAPAVHCYGGRPVGRLAGCVRLCPEST